MILYEESKVWFHKIKFFIFFILFCETTSSIFCSIRLSNWLLLGFWLFLVINWLFQKKRNRREVNCYDGLNDCCRDKLYISFKDIEWDDWILEPKGYEAYFCRGSCASAATSITDSGTHHSSVLRVIKPYNK